MKYQRKRKKESEDKIMANRIEVGTVEEAWVKVNEFFPTDYNRDEASSARAGYPIYRSSVEYYDYICDLNNRLEINLKDGNKTINVWIIPEEQGQDIEVTVAAKSGETRIYNTYAEFRKEFRFFLASGNRYKDNEEHYEKIIQGLREINEDGIKIETHRSGLTAIFTYKKWRK